MVIVDAFAHFDGDGNVSGSLDRALDDVPKEAPFPRQGRSPAFSGHLGNRAAKVQINVVTPVLIDQEANSF